jgi:hypothetical protein
MLEGATGFWSYVQADDEADGGRVTSLSRHLRAQYRVQTAEEFALFVDRDSLDWGVEWSRRIDEALAGTTFFIPMITPSYFKSQACRNELFKFTREAGRLGLEQLLLPIYWVTVPELEGDPAESADEAIRLVCRYQWQDLRTVRLEDEDSSAFRKAVSGLARELAARAVKVTNTIHDIPEAADSAVGIALLGDRTPARAVSSTDEDNDDAAWVLEKLAVSEDAMPKLGEIMEEMTPQIEKVGQLVSSAVEEMQAADARGQGMKARLVITERLARRLDEPADRIEDLGHRYAAVLTELDPGVHTWLDLAAHDAYEEEFIQLLQTIRSFATTADSALSELDVLLHEMNEAAKFSRSLRPPLRRMRTGLRGVLDGRAIIDDWGRRADDIARGETMQGEGQDFGLAGRSEPTELTGSVSFLVSDDELVAPLDERWDAEHR